MNEKIIEQNELITYLQNKIQELEAQSAKESHNMEDVTDNLGSDDCSNDVIDQMNDKIMKQNELLKNVLSRLALLEKVQEK